MRRFTPGLITALLALCLLGCQPRGAGQQGERRVVDAARAEELAEQMGLGKDIRQKTLTQFKAMGFSIEVHAELADSSSAAFPSWVQGALDSEPGSALFSVARGHGSSAQCWVAIRPSRARVAMERHLAKAIEEGGASQAAAWRAMMRHELAHCALAQMSLRDGAPDVFLSEPFADVFALDWSTRVDPEGHALAGAFGPARRLVGAGAHATADHIDRWEKTPSSPSPCWAAWSNSPIDARVPSAVCPKP